MIEELGNRVWSRPLFHTQAADLLQSHLKRTLLLQDVPLASLDGLNKLARAAAILSAAKEPERKLLAYRIASALAEGRDRDLACTRFG